MFGIPRIYGYIGAALLVIGLVVGIRIHFSNDAKVRAQRDGLVTWQSDAVKAVAEASDNPDTTKDTAIGQVRELGHAYRASLDAIEDQNRTIDDMAREAVRLRKHADELKAIAAKAQAQRKSALRRLSDMSITPGTRDDCLALLREANEALDIAREAGL